MKPTVSCAAVQTGCNKAITGEVTCTSGSNAGKSGSCNTPGGTFCCHDHTYVASQYPDPTYAFYTYDFAGPIALSSVQIEQHSNGIDCLRAELDGKDAGTHCVSNQGNGGGDHFTEHEMNSVAGFD